MCRKANCLVLGLILAVLVAGAGADELVATVKSELESMLVSDQLYRGSMVETSPEQMEEAWAKQREIDSRNVKRLDEIVEKHGWPGLSRFGEKATTAAFLVVQHADLPYQQRYLPLLRIEAAKGELPASHLPLLEDRVRLRTGHKQIYGTQLTKNAAGQWEPQPIEDEEHVDERRARAGLEPLSEYIKRNADREKQQRSDVSGNHSR